MNIIIAGDGEVGLHLAKELADENHDITIVDPHEDLLKMVESHTDLMTITGDSTSPLRNGRLGMIDRFTVYMSHNIKKTGANFDVIAGHKMGFTFASQMTEMETIRSESTFGNIVRGLQVYGYKVVKPEAIAQAVVTL